MSIRASSAREVTPSQGWTLPGWCPTVRWFISTRAAISRSVSPSAAGWATRSSWAASPAPGPSDPDGGSGGPENDATHRSIAFTTDTLMHLAAMIRGALGLPARGDRRTGGDGGTRPGHTDPAHR